MATYSPLTFATATGSSAINTSIAPASRGVLLALTLHLSAAGGAAEDLTVTLNKAAGAAYDVPILTQDMSTTQDVVWTGEIPFQNGDTIDVAYTNSNSRTYGLEVVYRKGA